MYAGNMLSEITPAASILRLKPRLLYELATDAEL